MLLNYNVRRLGLLVAHALLRAAFTIV